MTILRLLGSNFLWIVLPNWPSGANRKSKKLSPTSKKLLDKKHTQMQAGLMDEAREHLHWPDFHRRSIPDDRY
jgi:hypothetical protein